jgi:hypothetical protein
MSQIADIVRGYLQKICHLKSADIVNVYPQAINRMSSDETKNLSTLNPCDLQIVSQQKGVNLAI